MVLSRSPDLLSHSVWQIQCRFEHSRTCRRRPRRLPPLWPLQPREEQRTTGTLRIWAEPFTKLRVPKIYNLRSDPYERADITSNTYYNWLMSDGRALSWRGPAV